MKITSISALTVDQIMVNFTILAGRLQFLMIIEDLFLEMNHLMIYFG